MRAFAHVTGGGIPGNLVRVLPDHVDAVVNRSTWRPQPIFDLIQTKGRIEDREMESTFNMGVGMFAIVSANDADRALAFLLGRGVERLAGRRDHRGHRHRADDRLAHPGLRRPRPAAAHAGLSAERGEVRPRPVTHVRLRPPSSGARGRRHEVLGARRAKTAG